MGHMVIAAYQPKPGKQEELLQLVREHVPILRREGLATQREPLVMRAKDGTLLEIFEWTSQEAVERAHTNPVVLAMWKRFGEVMEYRRLADLAESADLFAHFVPVELARADADEKR